MEHICERNSTKLVQYIDRLECWTITLYDGMTVATYIKFCPFCGKKLEEVICSACSGSGGYRGGECATCNGTGWES